LGDAHHKWYGSGLRFSCTECGRCCTGPPGYVWVSREEIGRISVHLGRTDGWLDKTLLRRIGFKYSLVEKGNGDCVFLISTGNGHRGCAIYPVRPLQCRTWPFWNGNLKSPSNWAEAGEVCPGLNNGREFTVEEIEATRCKDSWKPGE
jgi:uncharacterized protein